MCEVKKGVLQVLELLFLDKIFFLAQHTASKKHATCTTTKLVLAISLLQGRAHLR